MVDSATTVTVIDACGRAQVPVLLVSDPGVGKSSLVRGIASAAGWTRAVNKYFSEKKLTGSDAWSTVVSLTSFGFYKDEAMFPKDQTTPIIENETIEKMDVDLSDDGRVWVTLKATADFNYVLDGEPTVSHAVRDQEYWLKEQGGRWKIDGWNGRIDIQQVS